MSLCKDRKYRHSALFSFTSSIQCTHLNKFHCCNPLISSSIGESCDPWLDPCDLALGSSEYSIRTPVWCRTKTESSARCLG